MCNADTVSNADTDGYGKVRTNTDWGTGGSESHVLRKFHSTWRSCWAEHSCAFSNTRGERGSRGKSKVSPVLHVHGFHPKAKRIPTGWQCALRRADTAGKECRTGRTCRTCRTIGTWCSECHVLLYFCSARLTESQSPTPYSSVPVRITLPALHSSVRSGGGPPHAPRTISRTTFTAIIFLHYFSKALAFYKKIAILFSDIELFSVA